MDTESFVHSYKTVAILQFSKNLQDGYLEKSAAQENEFSNSPSPYISRKLGEIGRGISSLSRPFSQHLENWRNEQLGEFDTTRSERGRG